jgi:hypothetical protein
VGDCITFIWLSIGVKVRLTGAELPLTGNAKRKALSAPQFIFATLDYQPLIEACSD